LDEKIKKKSYLLNLHVIDMVVAFYILDLWKCGCWGGGYPREAMVSKILRYPLSPPGMDFLA
jgi:hypothetical protein